jgi:hypothetical protein
MCECRVNVGVDSAAVVVAVSKSVVHKRPKERVRESRPGDRAERSNICTLVYSGSCKERSRRRIKGAVAIVFSFWLSGVEEGEVHTWSVQLPT